MLIDFSYESHFVKAMPRSAQTKLLMQTGL